MQCRTEAHVTHENESPWPLHFKHSHWWKRRSRSKFASHHTWGTNEVREYKDGCKVHMDFYMAPTVSCSMVTWIIFKNHLLEVHPEHLQLLIFLLHHVWGPAWIKIRWNSIWLRPGPHKLMTSHYTWRSVTTLHDFGGVLGRPWDTFFGLPQSHGHGSWLVCEVALITGSHSVEASLFLYFDFFVLFYSRSQFCTDMVFGGGFEEGWQGFWLISWTQTPAIWAAVGTISKISFLYAEVDLIELKNLPLHTRYCV
jgi:hypothetical protein